ncbi:MAG: FAD/NAD(P)-binding protein [Desulfuromonadales bacterium]|nr:FAD/NAD(P)-binding protein [Desulfuromonadales bacterium]
MASQNRAADSAHRYHSGGDASGEKLDNGEDLDLAIVGGGFSGLCTAYHLLSHAGVKSSFRCAIIEPCGRLGAGVAYQTDSPRHLLNVRAKGMSITENDPGSFVRWLSKAAPEFSPYDFVPRGLYRRYINDCLSHAIEQRQPGTLSLLCDEVIAVEPKSGSQWYLLKMKSGRTIRAKAVVLALGNLPPRNSLDNGLLHSPWSPCATYHNLRTMAIVGAGLTALDVILEAEARGFSGRYLVISPHGQFPKPHCEPHLPVPAELHEWAAELASDNPKLSSLLRAFQLKRKSGIHWEQLVDSFRKHSPAIWNGFSLRDKRLFLCRLRTLWNIHLHRSCQKSMQVVSRLKADGRLEQIAARVTGVEKLDGCVETAVRLKLQSGSLSTLDADLAINGTGLFSNILRTDSPLIDQLISSRLAQPDEFKLGLKVNKGGQVLSANGVMQSNLFTIGTLRRGSELESTAVPEIRKQVRAMVEEIVGRIAPAPK